MLRKLALLLVDAAVVMVGAAFASLGTGMAINDISAMKANKALPAPQPEAPAVEEAQNVEEATAE